MEILDTCLYQANKEKEDFWVTASKVQAEEKIEAAILDCCEKSLAKGGKKCCKSKSKNSNLVESGLSQVMLDVVSNNNARQITRHEARFGITSFIYRARRPFHPGRLDDLLLEPFFMLKFLEEEDEENGEDEKSK